MASRVLSRRALTVTGAAAMAALLLFALAENGGVEKPAVAPVAERAVERTSSESARSTELSGTRQVSAAAAGQTGSDLQLRVVDATSDQPVTEFLVSHVPAAASSIASALENGLDPCLHAGTAGKAFIEHARTEELVLRVRASGYATWVGTVGVAARECVVRLQPHAHLLMGRVEEASTGRPIAMAVVRVVDEHERELAGRALHPLSVVSQADGSFLLRTPEPTVERPVMVRASHSDFRSAISIVTDAKSRPVVQLHAGPRIYGTVFDASNRTIAGAEVRVPITTHEARWSSAPTTPGPSGRHR